MQLKIKCNNKKYLRKIESMGKGLVLFKVEAVDKKIGQKYHMFYADNFKPPLDVAINSSDGTIEYVSYFVQDELIEGRQMKNKIIYQGVGVCITNKEFNENNVHITEYAKFTFSMSGSDMWILRSDIDTMLLTEYGLDESNGMLFSNNTFCGMVLKNLNNEEIQEIRSSKCMI